MSKRHAIADRIEIEALRGEFTDGCRRAAPGRCSPAARATGASLGMALATAVVMLSYLAALFSLRCPPCTGPRSRRGRATCGHP